MMTLSPDGQRLPCEAISGFRSLGMDEIWSRLPRHCHRSARSVLLSQILARAAFVGLGATPRKRKGQRRGAVKGRSRAPADQAAYGWPECVAVAPEGEPVCCTRN